MSYELRIYIIRPFYEEVLPQNGSVLASFELGALDSGGPLWALIDKCTPKEAKFMVRAEQPDCELELIIWLKDRLDLFSEEEQSHLEKLFLKYEEREIFTDRYNDFLGVCSFKEFLETLKLEKINENARFRMVLAFLEEAKKALPHEGEFVKVVTYGH